MGNAKKSGGLKVMSGVSNSLVRYSSCCTIGEIVALLYNHAAQKKSRVEITPEVAEELVRKKLGDACTSEGRIVPSQEGYIDAINEIPLSVWCHDGTIDVAGYLHGDGKALIYSFIGERMSGSAKLKARFMKWTPVR